MNIKELRASPELSGMLADMLIEVVAGGGSVSFMHPLAPDAARGFWDRSLAAAERGSGSCSARGRTRRLPAR